MYGLLGIQKNVENIYKLAAPFVGDCAIVTMADLKPAYRAFLQSVHADYPIISEDSLIARDRTRIERFTTAFSASKLNDLVQDRMVGTLCDQVLFEQNVTVLERAIKRLQAIDPVLAELFDLCIHSIVLCGSETNVEGLRAHGGTTNNCIGLIWLNFQPDIEEQNLLEMLIHEMTHTLVFLDELNNSHFNYENVSRKGYWATSSILKRHRPMDKVIHSILVSMEILYARAHYLPQIKLLKPIHPISSSLLANVRQSIESVLDHPLLQEVCTGRSIALAKQCKFELNKYQGADHA